MIMARGFRQGCESVGHQKTSKEEEPRAWEPNINLAPDDYSQ